MSVRLPPHRGTALTHPPLCSRPPAADHPSNTVVLVNTVIKDDTQILYKHACSRYSGFGFDTSDRSCKTLTCHRLTAGLVSFLVLKAGVVNPSSVSTELGVGTFSS